MAELFNATVAAGATSSDITVVANTIVGIEVSQPVYVLAQNGAIIAETEEKDALNVIPTSDAIRIKSKGLASVVTVYGA